MIPRITSHISAAIIALFAATACAKPDVSHIMQEYLWEKRIIMIFSESPDSVDSTNQKNLMAEVESELNDRDIVTWHIFKNGITLVDGAPKPNLPSKLFYEHYGVTQEFTLILIGKDGEEKLRNNSVTQPDEIFRLIDSMPMRKQEMGN